MSGKPTPLDPSAIEAINADASRLMQHGIGRMGDTDRHAILHALECFDQALALRRQLPVIPIHCWPMASPPAC